MRRAQPQPPQLTLFAHSLIVPQLSEQMGNNQKLKSAKKFNWANLPLYLAKNEAKQQQEWWRRTVALAFTQDTLWPKQIP